MRNLNLAPRAVRSILLMAALALGMGACEFVYDPDDDDNPARELAWARKRWRREAPRDYSYDFERYCQCGADLSRTATVRVRNGAVVEVVWADDGSPVPHQYRSAYRTIDGLFEIIGDAINDDADYIDVDYDSRYGFPRSASIDYTFGWADDELSFRVRRFRAVRF